MPTQGNQLQLSFGVNAPVSRAIHKDATLPDNSPVGVKLDGYADYANLVYKGTTTGGKQSWTLAEGSVTLTDTKGTIYAYWPYSSTASIDAIDVDMTAADQTDWLYATPVTGIYKNKAEAAVTMNHAAANINITINKGTYLGSGAISNITLQSDGIALGGTFNAAQATPDYTAFEDEGKPLSRDLTTTTGAATDIMVVPTGASAAITFTATIDGIQFTATSAAVKLEKGNSYVYTLNLSDISTYMTVGSFGVIPWVTGKKEILELVKIDEFDAGIVATYHIDDAQFSSRAISGVDLQVLSTSTYFDISTIERMQVNGVEVEPSTTYTFTTPGNHIVKYLLADNTITPSYMFNNVTSIIDVKLPDGINAISAGTFYQCTGLTSVTIPNSVTSIAYQSFRDCTGLIGTLDIPNSVTGIGNYAFSGCSGLTGELVIPNSVKSIGDYAFAECSGLTSFTIPNSVTNVGTYSFFKCTGLTGELVIPESWSKLTSGLFSMTGFTSVKIPDNIKTIQNHVFTGCEELKEVTVGKNVNSIDMYAFSNCSKLNKITSLSTTAASIGTSSYGTFGVKNGGILIVPENSSESYANWMSYGYGNLAYTGWTCVEEGSYIYDNSVYYSTDGLTVLKCDNSYSGSININVGVKKISEYAFYGAENVSKIDLPNSVETIGEYAFYGCSGITELIIPNAVGTIGDYALYDCKSLRSITIGSSVSEIGIGVFYNCAQLKSIKSLAVTAPILKGNMVTSTSNSGVLTVPEGCSEAYAAWMGTDSGYLGCYNWSCKEDNEYILEGGVYYTIDGTTAIGWDGSQSTITIKSGTTAIAEKAFFKALALESVVIPESVTTIGNYAFAYCTGLTEVTIPNSVTSIGNEAFRDCSGVKKITIGTGLNKISQYSLGNLSSLEEVHILNPVMPSGFANAFINAANNVLLFVPNGSKSSYSSMSQLSSAFWTCLEEGNYMLENGIYYSADGLNILVAGKKIKGTATIKNGVVNIDERAFRYCTDIIEIIIPNSVTNIGNYAFNYCTSLKTIEIPDMATINNGLFQYCSSLETVKLPKTMSVINQYMFYNCTSLKNIIIPESVTKIDSYAFSGCSGLTEITIPAAVTSIGTSAFSSCTNLNRITSLATTAPNLSSNCFYKVKNNGLLYVPVGCTDAYATWMGTGSYYLGVYKWLCLEEGGYTFENGIYYSADGKTIIGHDGAVSGEVTIKDGVTSIPDKLFYGCTGITEVIIPNSVKSIGQSAFYGCTGLIALNLGDGVQVIGNDAFRNCSGLTGELNIPESVTSIGTYAFYGCKGIKVISFEEGVNEIGNYAFGNCTSITSATLPNSVTMIGNYVFYQCSKMTTVTIGSGVQTIGDYAFYSCTSLNTVVSLSAIAPEIQSNTFRNIKTNGTLFVPSGCMDAYAAWMGTGSYYLGYGSWNIQEQTN